MRDHARLPLLNGSVNDVCLGDSVNGGQESILATIQPAIPTHMFDWFPGNHRSVKSNSKANSTVMDSANCTAPPGEGVLSDITFQISGQG